MELAVTLGVLGAVVLAGLVVFGLYLSRQRTLSHRVGSFGCGLREDDQGTWTAGIAQYATGRLLWWRTLSLAPRPACTWSRSALTLVERSPLEDVENGEERLLLVRCLHEGQVFELTMSAAACAGLVSWLESGPRPVGRVI